jgi:hypothetical protein
MRGYVTALAFAGLAMIGTSAAAGLAAGSGYSIRLSGFEGVLYYTVAPDGYRVVATTASGPEGTPIRFVVTLAPGQRAVLSTPRSVGEPPVDLEIRRDADALLVSGSISSAPVELVGAMSLPAGDDN